MKNVATHTKAWWRRVGFPQWTLRKAQVTFLSCAAFRSPSSTVLFYHWVNFHLPEQRDPSIKKLSSFLKKWTSWFIKPVTTGHRYTWLSESLVPSKEHISSFLLNIFAENSKVVQKRNRRQRWSGEGKGGRRKDPNRPNDFWALSL